MKKHTAVVLLCMALIAVGLFHAPKDVRELLYMSGAASRQEADTEEEKDTDEKAEEKSDGSSEGDYIKWVEFHVTCEAMKQAYQYDLDTYGKEVHLNWVDLLAYLGARYGGDFTRYEEKDLEEISEMLLSGKKTIADMAADMQYYTYYREAYGAVLDGMVGKYEIEETAGSLPEKEGSSGTDSVSKAEAASGKNENPGTWKKVYGLKAFHPIAKGFPYTDYDDFGVSRTYGYRRNHLGHDMMGQVGTPVIAVESGYVAELGWNQYGGWRVGINSFDGKRYYYYAHLRKDRPYAEGLEKGDVVQAGDVIGYIGRTGYSREENVNNIDEYHLHFGLQLIFDESQREGNHEIWVSCYELVRFLYQHQSEVSRDDATKEWTRNCQIRDPNAVQYSKQGQGR